MEQKQNYLYLNPKYNFGEWDLARYDIKIGAKDMIILGKSRYKLTNRAKVCCRQFLRFREEHIKRHFSMVK